MQPENGFKIFITFSHILQVKIESASDTGINLNYPPPPPPTTTKKEHYFEVAAPLHLP